MGKIFERLIIVLQSFETCNSHVPCGILFILHFHGFDLLRDILNENQPPVQWVLGVKWPGGEADHSSLSSGKVKNVWNYTSTPPRCHHGVLLS
jgi:hypothetical protein